MNSQAEQRLIRIFTLLFILFVFSSTFSIALAQISIGFCLILFIVIMIIRKENPFGGLLKPVYLSIAAYVSWLLFTAAISYRPLYSLNLVKEDWLFCIVPIGIFALRQEEFRKKMINALTLGVFLISVYAVIQYLTGVHWFKDDTLHKMSFFGYRAAGNFATITFSNYMAMASIFLIGYALKAGRISLGKLYRPTMLTGLLGVLATILSFGRGASIAVVVALISLGIIMRHKYLFYVLGAVISMIVLVIFISPGLADRYTNQMMVELKGEYEGSRIFIWKHSAQIIAANPIVGVGTGNFKPAYAELLPEEIREERAHSHAHSDFLNIAAISGLPGLLLFLLIWFFLLRSIVISWHFFAENRTIAPFLLGSFLACIAFLVSSLTEATFADEEVRQFLMFIWAAGLWAANSKLEPATALESKRA